LSEERPTVIRLLIAQRGIAGGDRVYLAPGIPQQ
jgi:hypothetical protein